MKQLSLKRPRLSSPGFTLIEMLVVVAIIAILSSLLIVGISKLQTNAKRQQTAQLLENCRALWAEYDSVNRRHFDQFPIPCPGNVTLEVENQTEQGSHYIADRTGSYPVMVTRGVFQLMRSQPNIRAAMDKFPSGRMFLDTLSAGTVFQGGGQNTLIFPTNVTPWAPNNVYQCGFVATYQDPVTGFGGQYECIHQPPTGTATPPPPDTGYWLLVGSTDQQGNAIIDPTDPLLLDAWGNPIIFCTGGQLGTGAQISGNGTVPYGALVVNAKWKSGINFTSGTLAVVSNPGVAQSIIVSSPDKRPFWASAGPSGDFSRGDDNLYSFEK